MVMTSVKLDTFIWFDDCEMLSKLNNLIGDFEDKMRLYMSEF